MPRLEFVGVGSSKFWEITVKGTRLEVRWGRIGTEGQAKTSPSRGSLVDSWNKLGSPPLAANGPVLGSGAARRGGSNPSPCTALVVSRYAGATAVVFGGASLFMMSPLGEREFGSYTAHALIGWVASHAVGAVAGVVALAQARREGMSVVTVLLTLTHLVIGMVAGGLTFIYLLIASARFH